MVSLSLFTRVCVCVYMCVCVCVGPPEGLAGSKDREVSEGHVYKRHRLRHQHALLKVSVVSSALSRPPRTLALPGFLQPPHFGTSGSALRLLIFDCPHRFGRVHQNLHQRPVRAAKRSGRREGGGQGEEQGRKRGGTGESKGREERERAVCAR